MGWIRIFFISFLWAISFAINEILLFSHAPFAIVFYRSLFAASFLSVYCFFRAEKFDLSYRFVFASIILAIFNYVVPSLLLVWSQDKVGISIASLSCALTPLMTLGFMLLILKSVKLTLLKSSSVVVGAVGFILAFSSFGPINFSTSTIPFLAIMISSTSYSIGAVMGERFSHANPLVSAFGQMIMSTIILLPFSYFDNNIINPGFTTETVALLAVLGFACTGFAYILFYKSLQAMGSLATSFVAILVPSIVIFLEVFANGKAFNKITILGVVIVFISLMLIEFDRNTKSYFLSKNGASYGQFRSRKHS